MSAQVIHRRGRDCKSHRGGIRVGGEIFYCLMEVTSLKKEVSPPGSIILLGHQMNLRNKSTVIESVERVCAICVGELLAAFLNFRRFTI